MLYEVITSSLRMDSMAPFMSRAVSAEKRDRVSMLRATSSLAADCWVLAVAMERIWSEVPLARLV